MQSDNKLDIFILGEGAKEDKTTADQSPTQELSNLVLNTQPSSSTQTSLGNYDTNLIGNREMAYSFHS